MNASLAHLSALPTLVPKRRYGRWITAAVALLLLGFLCRSLARNPRIHWDVVAQNLTGASILSGVLVTLELTLIAVVLGFAGGVLLAVMRLSGNQVLAAISWGYVWLFRSVPMLVQLFFWFWQGTPRRASRRTADCGNPWWRRPWPGHRAGSGRRGARHRGRPGDGTTTCSPMNSRFPQPFLP